DLMDQGGRVIAEQGLATAATIGGPTIGNRADLLRRDQTALGPAMPRLPAPFPTGGRGGGLRLNPMGSDDGGLEEWVELSFSRASRSRTRCSSSRTRPWTESNTARMAIWASGGTVFQSGSGIGGRGIILLILRAYYTKGSVCERARRESSDRASRSNASLP